MFCTWFLVVFLVLFPKGGFKVGAVPITWGYMFLLLTLPPIALVRILALPLRVPRRVLIVMVMLVPMQIIFLYAWIVCGVSNLGYTISLLGSFIGLPITLLLIYPPFLIYVDGDRLSKYLRWCVLLAALWGILLFFTHPITHKFIEIPYLTVNAGDYGNLEYTKNISRGLFFKLISTYNNGNLYGVCTLMLMPLYDLMEPIRWRRNVIKVALLLSLSRTVWAGLVISEALSVGILLSKQLRTFPKLYLGKAAKRTGALFLIVGLIFATLLFNSNKLTFLFDLTLGNRVGLTSLLPATTFLPIVPVAGLNEAAFVSSALYFGWSGFVAFSLLMLSPLLLLFYDSSPLRSPVRRAALKGMVLYIILANVDAAFVFIPSTAFFWFVYMIYLYGWPQPHSKAIASRATVPQSLHPAPPLVNLPSGV